MRNSNIPVSVDEVLKRKEKFAELMGQGLGYIQAAKHVGIMSESGAKKYREDPIVKQILKKIHNENIRELQMTREKVQAIVIEAVDMGRTLADPLAMIRGAQEINKMCGFYAAEEKKIILTTEQRRMITQFDDMSDEDIAKMLENGEISDAVEAEFTEIFENE